MNRSLTASPQNKKAFSLVELLVVLAIMGVLAYASIPAISSITNSYNLTAASNGFLSQLNYGRQQAIALNGTVEVRFYQYQISGFPDEPASGSFHSYQLFKSIPQAANTMSDDHNTSWAPLTRVQHLPGRVVMSSNTNLSPLLNNGGGTTGGSPPPAGVPAGYTYRAFHFRPDGSTDIPVATAQNGSNSSNNFITLADIVNFSKNASTLPSNYAAIIIDPIAGSAKEVRP
jgi:uncharacterized protein (TIGR02596 family)